MSGIGAFSPLQSALYIMAVDGSAAMKSGPDPAAIWIGGPNMTIHLLRFAEKGVSVDLRGGRMVDNAKVAEYFFAVAKAASSAYFLEPLYQSIVACELDGEESAGLPLRPPLTSAQSMRVDLLCKKTNRFHHTLDRPAHKPKPASLPSPQRRTGCKLPGLISPQRLGG